ncbi:MAG: MbnP family copper-binding protein, partial [Polyangiales bacterium]
SGTGGTAGTGGTGGVGGADAQAVSIAFVAKVGDADFECGTTYDLGSADTPLELADFRFYVEGIELQNDADEWVAVSLDDTNFQTDDVALLDFEDGCGELGNADLNEVVTGTVPVGTYSAVRFNMGVPFEMNHENPAVAPPPMNLTSMHWNWQGGYKFLRVDAAGFSSGGWRTHLGSTGCDGDPISGGTTECTTPNVVNVELDGFDPGTNAVVADLAALVAGQDLDNIAPMPPGCMSGPTDPDCTSIFANLGLPFEGVPAPGPQTFFRMQ